MQKKTKIKLLTIIFTIFFSFVSLLLVPRVDLFKTLVWLFLLLLGWWNLISFYVELFMGRVSLPRARKLLDKHLHFNLKPGNPLLLVLLPLIIVVIVELPLWSYFHFRPTEMDWQVALTSILLAPFIEEYIFRQLLFDELLLKKLKELIPVYNLPWVAPFWFVYMLLFQALLFAYMHENIDSWFSFWSRFGMGLLCGILYMAYKRNLVPAISAHTTSNLLVSIAALVNNLH